MTGSSNRQRTRAAFPGGTCVASATVTIQSESPDAVERGATRAGAEIVRAVGSNVKPYLDMMFIPNMGGPEREEETMKVPSNGWSA